MFKFLIFALLFAYAASQQTWSPGVRDSRCQPENGVFPQFFPGPTCRQYLKCNDGWMYTMNCPDNLHWNVARTTCDHPEDAGCTFRRRFDAEME